MTRIAALASLMLIAVLFFAPSASADGFTVTVTQVGPDVVATGSGAINLTGLALSTSFAAAARVDPGSALLILGSSGTLDDYTGASGPSSFGAAGSTLASSATGVSAGILGPADIFVPQGYISETPLADTSTWSGQTLSSLGLMPGTYTWTWGTGTDQKFTLEIGAPVPEPSSLMLLGSGMLGLIGLVRRKLRL